MSMQLAAVVASKVAAKALQSLSSAPPVRYVSYLFGSNDANSTNASGVDQNDAETPSPANGHTKRLGSVNVLRQAVAWLLPPAVVYTGQARSVVNASKPELCGPAACGPALLGPALLGPTLSVGSACNAVYAGNRYNLVINCCPSEVRISSAAMQSARPLALCIAEELESATTSPEVIEVNLEDTNDAQLDVDEMVRVIGRAQQVWNRNGHILVNCWMGASRSVAVTCVLMCCLDRCITQSALNTARTAAKQETEASTQHSLFDRMAAAEEAFNCAYGLCSRARPTVNMSKQLCAEVKRVLVALF